MYAIETRGLCKSFGSRIAVRELDLTVEAGGVFSLLGVNGAGKTTTIRMLTGLTKPTAGSARVMGMDVVKDPRGVKAVIGVSPQETAVAPNLTVRENLDFMASLYKNGGRRRGEEVLTALKLDTVAGQRAGTLSGGWQRRLSIAMALVSKPKLLFLDEPTLGLDVLARRELWQVIRSLRRDDTTVLLTTHYLEEAEALSDSIAVMANGRLQAVGTAAQLKQLAGKDTFEEAFVALCSGEVGL